MRNQKSVRRNYQHYWPELKGPWQIEMNRGLWKNYAAANRDNFLLIRKKQKREGKGKEKEGEGEGERRGKEEKEKEKTESH